MKNEEFDKVVEERIEKIRKILLEKREDYASGGKDRLHNFNRAAWVLRTTPEKALIGMWTKHVVSILDMIDDLPVLTRKPDYVEEKIGDAINYLILLEAMYKSRIS